MNSTGERAWMYAKAFFGMVSGGTGMTISLKAADLEIWLRIAVLATSLVIGLLTIRSLIKQQSKIDKQNDSRNS